MGLLEGFEYVTKIWFIDLLPNTSTSHNHLSYKSVQCAVISLWNLCNLNGKFQRFHWSETLNTGFQGTVVVNPVRGWIQMIFFEKRFAPPTLSSWKSFAPPYGDVKMFRLSCLDLPLTRIWNDCSLMSKQPSVSLKNWIRKKCNKSLKFVRNKN